MMLVRGAEPMEKRQRRILFLPSLDLNVTRPILLSVRR